MPVHQRNLIKRCFIIAPWYADLSIIKNVIVQKGIQPISLAKFTPGHSVVEQIREASEDSIVIAIVDDTSNPNLFYELGVARALSKRILVLLSPSIKIIPFDILELPYIRANPDNKEALSFAIDSIVGAQKQRRITTSTQQYDKQLSKLKPLEKYADDFLASLNIQNQPNEKDIENIVVSALSKGGISIIERSNRKGKSEADLAVWVDELDTIIGNPLLIEIKDSIKSISQFYETIKQVESSLERANSRIAMVLYNNIEVQVPEYTFPILFLSVRQLIERLKNDTFGNIVINLRNKQVHG